MRLKQKLIVKALLLLTLISLNACATPISNACGWAKQISPNPGFETRWTRDEKNQVDAYDQAVDKNCGYSI